MCAHILNRLCDDKGKKNCRNSKWAERYRDRSPLRIPNNKVGAYLLLKFKRRWAEHDSGAKNGEWIPVPASNTPPTTSGSLPPFHHASGNWRSLLPHSWWKWKQRRVGKCPSWKSMLFNSVSDYPATLSHVKIFHRRLLHNFLYIVFSVSLAECYVEPLWWFSAKKVIHLKQRLRRMDFFHHDPFPLSTIFYGIFTR